MQERFTHQHCAAAAQVRFNPRRTTTSRPAIQPGSLGWLFPAHIATQRGAAWQGEGVGTLPSDRPPPCRALVTRSGDRAHPRLGLVCRYGVDAVARQAAQRDCRRGAHDAWEILSGTDCGAGSHPGAAECVAASGGLTDRCRPADPKSGSINQPRRREVHRAPGDAGKASHDNRCWRLSATEGDAPRGERQDEVLRIGHTSFRPAS